VRPHLPQGKRVESLRVGEAALALAGAATVRRLLFLYSQAFIVLVQTDSHVDTGEFNLLSSGKWPSC
jgi:hypothetical protein